MPNAIPTAERVTSLHIPNLKSIAPALPSSSKNNTVNNINAIPIMPGVHPIMPAAAAMTPIPIPCNMLTIGSWRRISVSNDDLICVYLPSMRMLRYVIQEQGARFLLDYPVNIILQMTVDINAHSNLASMQVTVSGPPLFAMELKGKPSVQDNDNSSSSSSSSTMVDDKKKDSTSTSANSMTTVSNAQPTLLPQHRPWIPCRDFTEKHQASQVFKYMTTAPGRALQESIQKVLAIDAGLRLLTTINQLPIPKTGGDKQHGNTPLIVNHDSFIHAKTASLIKFWHEQGDINRCDNAKPYRFTNISSPAGSLVPVSMAQPNRSMPPVSHFQHQFRIDDPIEATSNGTSTFSPPKRPPTLSLMTMGNQQSSDGISTSLSSAATTPTINSTNEHNEPNSPALSVSSAHEALEMSYQDDMAVQASRTGPDVKGLLINGRSRSLSATMPPSSRRAAARINSKRSKRFQPHAKPSSSLSTTTTATYGATVKYVASSSTCSTTTTTTTAAAPPHQQASLMTSLASNLPLSTVFANQMNNMMASSAPNLSSQSWLPSQQFTPALSSSSTTTTTIASLDTTNTHINTNTTTSSTSSRTMFDLFAGNSALSEMLGLQLNASQSTPVLDASSLSNGDDGMSAGSNVNELDDAAMVFIRDPTPPASTSVTDTPTSTTSPVDIPMHNVAGLGLDLTGGNGSLAKSYALEAAMLVNEHESVSINNNNNNNGNSGLNNTNTTMTPSLLEDESDTITTSNTASMPGLIFEAELPSADLQLDANDLFLLST
ncbi:hypothetical protein BDF22DRAFT_745422 [Syncephalis plumigaleata]|nr:hypothetical protein BDF22DRAFT_745422 [Syncephalis plumigaleata]